jgi:hypothetical protein
LAGGEPAVKGVVDRPDAFYRVVFHRNCERSDWLGDLNGQHSSFEASERIDFFQKLENDDDARL